MAERVNRRSSLDRDTPSRHPDTGIEITRYEASEGRIIALEAVTERSRGKGCFTARLDLEDKTLQKN